MYSRIVIAVVVLAVVFASAVPAYACKCAVAPPPDPNATPIVQTEPRQLNDNSVVFEGQVSKLDVLGWPKKLARGEKFGELRSVAKFSDVRVYEGRYSGELAVETGIGGGDCGYEFLEGERYLVYAWENESGRLETSICSSTSSLEDAGEALERLRGLSSNATRKPVPKARPHRAKLCGRILGLHAMTGTVTVHLLRPRPSPLPLIVFNEQGELKRDGSFCIADVRAGKYIVEAEQAYEDSRIQRIGYYSSGAHWSEATPVEVRYGAPTPFLQFELAQRPVFSVEGWAVFPPNHNGNRDSKRAVLLPRTGGTRLMASESIDENGSFRFDEVPAGTYSLFVVSDEDESDSVTIVSSVLELEVTGDLTGLRVDLTP